MRDMSATPAFSLIYQLFLGRLPQANTLDHLGFVLNKMLELDWQILNNAGFTHVYLTGLWKNQGRIQVTEEQGLSLIDARPRCPSVFALTDHTAINPDLGTSEDFHKLLELIHQTDVKVLVDFVPNHTGLDHPWITSHPDYYSWEDGKLLTEFSHDVAKLNYQNQALREQMLTILLEIAETGVDGVRVDMAHLIATDFWQATTEAVRRHFPQFKFIAEAYADSVFDWGVTEELIQAGFTTIYHEFLFRNLNDYFQGRITIQDVVNYLNYVIDSNYHPSLLSYLMNHDDVLVQEGNFARQALEYLLLLLPTDKLFFNGQTLGLSHRLAHHWTELLDQDKCELSDNFPASWLKLKQLIDDKKLKIEKAIFIRDGVMSLSLNSNNKLFCCFNLSQSDYDLSDGAEANKSILFKHDFDVMLKPGGFVIYEMS
jgi:hypothetical protein